MTSCHSSTRTGRDSTKGPHSATRPCLHSVSNLYLQQAWPIQTVALPELTPQVRAWAPAFLTGRGSALTKGGLCSLDLVEPAQGSWSHTCVPERGQCVRPRGWAQGGNGISNSPPLRG